MGGGGVLVVLPRRAPDAEAIDECATVFQVGHTWCIGNQPLQLQAVKLLRVIEALPEPAIAVLIKGEVMVASYHYLCGGEGTGHVREGLQSLLRLPEPCADAAESRGSGETSPLPSAGPR